MASKSQGQKHVVQQLPIPSREGHNAIIHSNYLDDVAEAVESWKCKLVVLVHSRALDLSTPIIKNLKKKLGRLCQLPNLAISQLLHDYNADCLIGVGSSLYSDACKIARLLHATLDRSTSIDSVEALVDQEKGLANEKTLKDPKVKLILVPTSLSASEWNHVSSATNPQTHKKQHFATKNAAPDLILLDPEVASTSPRQLWFSSGMRAVDHCVETLCNPQCTQEDATRHMEDALAVLLKGLKEYKEGENESNREEVLSGISECQLGSRQAMTGLLLYRNSMGASHAIGHQLGSVKGVMHGVTSCIMLAPVLRYMRQKGLQEEAQARVLKVFNDALGWHEKSAADVVERFVKMLELPSSLKEVVTEGKDLELVAEKTMTDVWGGGERQVNSEEEVLRILEMATSERGKL